MIKEVSYMSRIEQIQSSGRKNNELNKTINAINGFVISPEGSKLLVYNNIERIYRRSYNASYYVFEIKRNNLMFHKPSETENIPSLPRLYIHHIL